MAAGNNLKVIVGEDDFLVAEAAAKAVGGDVGLEVIDSRTSTNADLQLADLRAADASVSTPPFLEPRRVTWWKNVGFLPQSGKGAPSAEVKEALEKFARKLVATPLPENQLFVLSGTKLLMTSVFAKTLKGAAEIITFATGRPQDQRHAALERVREFAGERNLQFAARADEALVDRVGVDTRSLLSEIEKLRAYLGRDRHTVERADVEAICLPGAGVEPNIWELTDAIGTRDLEKALTACRQFEDDSGFAVFIPTVVEKFFRQLLALKDAEVRKQFAAATEGTSPWVANKNRGFLKNWTLRELFDARRRFIELRERAVSSSASAEVLVVTELVRTLSKNIR